MSKEDEEKQKRLEARAKAFADRLDSWTEKHFADPEKPECPVCAGVKWVWLGNPINLATVKVVPRCCASCGYTMFFNADLIG